MSASGQRRRSEGAPTISDLPSITGHSQCPSACLKGACQKLTLFDQLVLPDSLALLAQGYLVCWLASLTLATAEMTDPAAILIHPAAYPLAPTRCNVPAPCSPIRWEFALRFTSTGGRADVAGGTGDIVSVAGASRRAFGRCPGHETGKLAGVCLPYWALVGPRSRTLVLSGL
jgi:hypothetical protein